jgi:hypothetical protein
MNGVQAESDFSAYVFPHLLSETILVGNWMGFDWEDKFTSGPIVYSRDKVSSDELNKAVSAARLPNMDLMYADMLIDKLKVSSQ